MHTQTILRWILFWLGWSLLISAIYWILGPHSYLRIQDTADFNLTYRITTAKDLLTHGVTYWQPKFSGGMPSWPLPQTDSFLITTPLYLILPPWLAYGFLMALQRFIASYFTFRLCQDYLGLDRVSSLFAGMAFSLNHWSVQDWTLYDGLGPPGTALFLWLFERIMQKPGWRGWILMIGLGFFVSQVASTALYTVHLCGAIPLWLLLVRKKSLTEITPYLLIFIFSALLMVLPSLIALFTYSPETSRGLVDFSIIQPFKQTVNEAWNTFFERDLFHNRFVLGIAVVGMLLVKGKDRLMSSLIGAFLLAGIGSQLLHMMQLYSGDILPPSRGNLKDLRQFTVFLAPLMGGCGLHLVRHFFNQTNQQKTIKFMNISPSTGITWLVLMIPLMALVEVTQLLARRIPTDNYHVQFENPHVHALANLAINHSSNPRLKPSNNEEIQPFRVATVGARIPTVKSASGNQFYPGFTFAYGLESVDGYYRMHSARYENFWLQVISGLLSQEPVWKNRTSKLLYLFKPNSGIFDRVDSIDVASYYNLSLLSLANTRFLISHWPLNHPDLLLRTRPTLEIEQKKQWKTLRNREKILRTLKGDTPHHALYIYENQSVLPRAFLSSKVEILPDNKSLMNALKNRTTDQLRETVLLQQTESPDLNDLGKNSLLTPPMNDNPNNNQVTWTRYTPDRLSLNIKNTKQSVLVIGNTFDPHWKVWIDGKPSQLFPVYHTFQGTLVDAGQHTVVLEYWPPYRLF